MCDTLSRCDGSRASLNKLNPTPRTQLRASMCPVERITKELQAGLQERRQQSHVHQQKQAAALEGFLADEISSHTCPICYELMLAPQRAPTLLFPCGEACTAQWLGHSVGCSVRHSAALPS